MNIVLKQVIKYDNANAIEATWVAQEQLPDVEVPEVPAVLDEDGNVVTPAIPAYTKPGEIKETQIRCHAYAGTQMQMFRDDVATYGGNIADYEDLIADIEANIVPPEPIPVIVPSVVTMRQARLALLQSNLLSQVEAAIAGIEDLIQRQAVQIEWEYAAEVNRTHPWVQTLATALELSKEQLDELFTMASTL